MCWLGRETSTHVKYTFRCICWRQNSRLDQPVYPCSLSGPVVIKLFSCSTQLSMKSILLINLKTLTIFFLTSFILNSAEHAQLSWAWKKFKLWYFYFYDKVKFHAQLSWEWKTFYNLGARPPLSDYRKICRYPASTCTVRVRWLIQIISFRIMFRRLLFILCG